MAISYSYPKPLSGDTSSKLTRDEILNKDLELTLERVMPSPKQIYDPFVKQYNRNCPSSESLSIPLNGPIDDIFRESQQRMDVHTISFPCNDHEEHKLISSLEETSSTTTNNNKRKAQSIMEPMEQTQTDKRSSDPFYYGEVKTPTKKSHRGLDTSSTKTKRSSMKQSTPVAGTEDITTRKSRSAVDESRDPSEEDVSQDPLACHAGNIMRMAMDSTMMDSFCNHSFSSTFSNLIEESVLGKNNADGDDSVLERLKSWPKSSLDPKRAKKIEISAEELHSAINEPIR